MSFGEFLYAFYVYDLQNMLVPKLVESVSKNPNSKFWCFTFAYFLFKCWRYDYKLSIANSKRPRPMTITNHSNNREK